MITLISLIVVLGVLIFIHEAGHFIAAKWAGIYVHRFSLGLGSPVPWLTFRRGETEYSISWLPLGGYVKMASREEDIVVTVANGRTNTEIADELHISLSTVKTHLASVMAKLGARNRVEIAMWAYETNRVTERRGLGDG